MLITTSLIAFSNTLSSHFSYLRKREILVLHYFGGLKLKEIAALMKITTENVKIIIYRGRNELKKSMEENGYDIS